MINIKFKKLNSEVVIPIPAHEGDAGADVIAVSRTWLDDKKCWEYGLGFSTEIPLGYKGIIVPRSSISNYDLVMPNSPAQIDRGYSGEWKVRLKELSEKPLHERKIYDVGDKIAQIFFEEVVLYHFTEVTDLAETSRGEGGFGSTDKK